MPSTEHNNFQLIPSSPVEWPAIINDFMNKVEAGRTLKLVAGETIAQFKGFKIDATNLRALVSDDSSTTLGIWQSSSTVQDAEGFGQYNGTMDSTSWSWTPGVKLYIDGSGDLTADSSTPSRDRVALAISATEIVLLPPL